MLQGRSGIRSRGRLLVFLTVFCSFVLLGSASGTDAPDRTDTPSSAPADAIQPDPSTVDTQSQTELQPTPPPGPEDDFGASTALSGNTAAIGSPGANGGAGDVTVFVIGSDGTATQQATLTPPTDSSQHGYGSALSTDGDTLAVGAPGNPDNEAVDLYDLATTALIAQLTGQDNVGPESGYGTAVAVSGDWLAVGAPQTVVCSEECSDYYPDGAVLIYHREDGVWVQTPYQVLLGPDSSAFGSALALDGLTLVVGAPDETIYSDSQPYGLTAGAAHVYTLVEGEGGPYWAEAGPELTDPNAIYGGGFGTAVAVDGATIAVGAPNPSADGDPGRVVVFNDPYGEGNAAPQTISGPADGYRFGRSVALDDGNLAIGYLQSDFSGAVDLYSQTAGAPTPTSPGLTAAGDPFTYQGTQHGTGSSDNYGQSLALSGSHLLVGGGGHVYLVGGHPSSPPDSGGSAGSTGGGLTGTPLRPKVGNPGGGGAGPGLATADAAAALPAVNQVQVPPHIENAPESEPKHVAESHEGTEGESEGATESDRSSFADRVLSPAQLDFSFTNLAEGGLIAFLLAALLYLPVTIFNKATERNHETITGWLAGPRRRMEAAMERIPLARHPLALLLSTGVVSGLLFSFVEPGFPKNAGSLQYLTGMVLGFVLVAIVFFGTWREVVHRLEPESEGRWRLYPPYIVLAIMLVALARLAHFLPGVVLGTLAEYEPGKKLSKRTAGLRVLITYSLLLVVGFGAWFAWIPVEHAAAEPGASSLTLIGDSALAVIFVTGLESVVFGLIPLTFLDGHDLWAWKKGLWLTLWGLGVYWFSVVILHPALSTYNHESSAGVFWFGILFGGLMIVALSTWSYFAIRERRERRLKTT
jgi:hypothetical protein